MKLFKLLRTIALILVGIIASILIFAMLIYPPEYVFRTIVWRDSDVFDWQKFPSHTLKAAPAAYHFDEAIDPQIGERFAKLAGTDDWNVFLAANHTQAFIVIQDGKVRYENYFNNTRRDSIVTSFLVAKSFGSALIGLAIQEGYIKSATTRSRIIFPSWLNVTRISRRSPSGMCC